MGSESVRGKLVAIVVLALAGVGVTAVARRRPDAPPAAAAKDPRQVLRRPWFDRLPKARTDEVDIWWFSGAGIGMHDRGSQWRSTLDLFDFERQSSRLSITFLQDKKRLDVPFEVVSCSDKPPFDLCLDVQEPLRGKKRLYSFSDDDEMDAAVPWARAWRAAAEARTRREP